jgi:hypothetical protein
MAQSSRSNGYSGTTWKHGSQVLRFYMGTKAHYGKQALKWWEKTFSYHQKEKEEIKGKLERLQKDLEENKSLPNLQKEEIDLQCQYQRALRKEEEYWHLKSRSLWLKVGDKNTKYFHNQAKYRQSKNNVANIILEDGINVTEFEDIKKAAKNHFADLYAQQEEADQSNIIPCLSTFPLL